MANKLGLLDDFLFLNTAIWKRYLQFYTFNVCLLSHMHLAPNSSDYTYKIIISSGDVKEHINRTVYSDVTLRGRYVYGCREDPTVIDVLQYDEEFQTWHKIKQHSTACVNHFSSDSEASHTIVVNGDHFYSACGEIGVKLKRESSIQEFRYIDRFDSTDNSLTRFEEIGDLFQWKQKYSWSNIKVIDAILHENVLFAVCLEHKRVIKVVLEQNEEQL